MSAVTVWEWKSGNGGWNPYVPAVSNYVETAYAKWRSGYGQTRVELRSVTPEFYNITVEFDSSSAVNSSTGWYRALLCSIFTGVVAYMKLLRWDTSIFDEATEELHIWNHRLVLQLRVSCQKRVNALLGWILAVYINHGIERYRFRGTATQLDAVLVDTSVVIARFNSYSNVKTESCVNAVSQKWSILGRLSTFAMACESCRCNIITKSYIISEILLVGCACWSKLKQHNNFDMNVTVQQVF